MTGEHVAFIGLDTSKFKISVAVADGERKGEVRFLGDISSEPASVAGMVRKLAERGAKLHTVTALALKVVIPFRIQNPLRQRLLQIVQKTVLAETSDGSRPAGSRSKVLSL